MTKYIVTIEETISQEFIVDANDDDEALSVARTKYRDGQFVIEFPSNVSAQGAITFPESETTEFTEF